MLIPVQFDSGRVGLRAEFACLQIATAKPMDLSSVTVTPETLGEGVIAINAAGEIIVGAARLCSATSKLGEAVLGIMKLGG